MAAKRLNGVVLLVEDEPSVRAVARRMMEMRGLKVIAAESPDEAIRLVEARRDRIDILLTDVQLPGMDGPEVARRIRALQPDLKVVFISGYPREEAATALAFDKTAEYLQKPFTPVQLTELLRRVLESAGPEDTMTTPHPAKTGDTQKLPPVGGAPEP
jgi:two-component system, cell cycle sensor histidine kinase and response regulator CckA